MNNYLRRAILAIFLTIISTSLWATHIIGGDITYECLGSDRYRIMLTVYTECGSQAVLEQRYPISYYAEDLGILPGNPRRIDVVKRSTTEIKLFCDAVVTDCSGGSQRGVEKVIYEGFITLNQPSSDWRFFWKRASRSEVITTLVAPETEDFFIESSINNKASACNNSPVFGGPAVMSVCINQEQTYNNVASDPENDILKYSLSTPKSNYNEDVLFETGFGADKFMTLAGGASLDANSGDLVFTPTLLEVGILDYKIEEFRNGISIGWVKRGIQFTGIDCSNALPVISDLGGLSSSVINVCAGELINYTFNASDADGDKVVLRQLEGPGIVLLNNNNTSTPAGSIVWNIPNNELGTYNIVIEATDNRCPQPGVTVKTFTINVRSTPQFTMPTYAQVACDETITLEPAITGGDGDYSFLWSDGTTKLKNSLSIGTHTLTVTDGTGCAYSRTIKIDGELIADFATYPLCQGIPSDFVDKTTHLNASKNIVSWRWDFGDGNISSDQNASHIYASSGTYEVILQVTDDSSPACIAETKKEISICAPFTFDYNITGQCTYAPISISVDTVGALSCAGIKSIFYDFGDGSVSDCTASTTAYCTYTDYTYDVAGTYELEVTITNLSGCTSTVKKTIEVFASPEVDIIQDDYYLICSKPDSLIQTTIVTGGTGDITYLWNTGEVTEDIVVATSGFYNVTAIDELGCSFQDYLSVTYPLRASFKYEPYCEEGDIVKFKNYSVSQTNVITDYEWNFGDPESGDNTAATKDPSHEFSSENDYFVKLKVVDSDGCTDFISDYVFNTSLDDYQMNLPDEICEDIPLLIKSPTGPHIDYNFWNFGDFSGISAIDPYHTYTTGGQYTVNLEVVYNTNFRAEANCKAYFKDSIVVNDAPMISIEASKDRFCTNDPIIFNVATDSDIADIQWSVTNTTNGGTHISNDLVFEHIFKKSADYRIDLVVTDDKGCISKTSVSGYAARVVTPDFDYDVLCAGTSVWFDKAYRDTLENVTDYRWDFGNGEIKEGPVPMPLINYQFSKGGIYPVTLTLTNSFSGCSNSVTKMVEVLSVPEIEFTYDTICARSAMTLTNLTKPGDVASFTWKFPDGSTQNTRDAKFVFMEPGYFDVSLIAISSLGCSDTVTHTVYVKPSPVAKFSTNLAFIEAFVPIQFYDESEGDITSYYWDLGDGTISTEKDVIHTFDAIEQYPLIHAVTNDYACSDTLKVLLDLDVYLDVPTGFSPNLDGKNDRLKLIQQGITTLHTYKVYNRHGQMVFDAQGNVEAMWDGIYKGKPQPAGVYVVHVQASGAYGREYNFKRNVTLLR